MTAHDWKRVKAIAGEAWILPVSDRIPYVARECGVDEPLNSEVLSLLASMDAAADCFEVPPAVRGGDIGVHRDLIGCQVGVYEILSRIGAGGMGEVYKARDTRLNRIVAIKTVPPGASGLISRERTEHEARAVAALNHPHICTLYDIGNHDGLDFLVLQYVEGETLADRLARGRLAPEEALRYADQIASALAEAHRVGIVDRDVKPANIMLDRAGEQSAGAPQAKLLDFGIAKAQSFATPFASTLAEMFAAPHLTAPGLVVGTPQYMAPEQLERNDTDVRTDVFAFGAVLFEMLSGRKAFEGADKAALLAAIREKEVSSLSALVPRIPASLDRLVSRSLAKNPADRYQTMDDLLIDLRAVRRQFDSSWHLAPVTVGVVGLMVVILVVFAWALGMRRDVAANVSPSISRLPASAGVLSKAVISPDGSNIVFSWTGDGINNPELVLVRIGSGTRVRLTNDPGTEEWPAWSPDGRQIAFIRCGTERCGIFTIPIDGGPEHKLRDLRYDRYNDLAWSPDGRSIVYAERPSLSDPYALFDLALDNSGTRRLTTPRRVNLGELRFTFSPDSARLAIIRIGASIEVLLHSIKDGTEKILLTDQHEWFGGVEWSADGEQLILSANQQGVRGLWTLAIAGGNLQRLAVAGEDSYYPSLSWRSGRLAFVRQFRDWDFTRVAIDRRSVHASANFLSSERLDLDPVFSPDGRKLAFVSERSGTREVWVSNPEGSETVQLTSFGGTPVGRPSWSPDSQLLAFHAAGIQIVPATGGPPRRVAEGGEMPSWSADARWIYFMRSMPEFQVWKVPAAGGRAVRAITSEAFTARESPDGLDLYFPTASGGMWRRPVAGGVETRVIQDFEWPLPGYWALFEDGIYYVVRETLLDHTVVNRLKFFDFRQHRTVNLGLLTGAIDDWVGGLTVSPDRKTLLYSHRTYQSSEVVLVEHFR
jgi:eukaryotic-like serine/threonine-protein kinase